MPTLTYTVSGLVGSDTLVAEPVLSTTATASSPVGTYPITAQDAVATSDYTITCVSGTLTVTPAPFYNFSGFLPPLSQNLAFALGRSIPIKFQLTNANGMLAIPETGNRSLAE